MPFRQTWLLLDVNYLCYRAFFSGGSQLSFKGEATGIIYGVLRTVQDLQDRFNTRRVVFCFDHGKGVREQDYPAYKANRPNRTKKERKRFARLRAQVSALKLKHLPAVGFKNVFYQDGLEADDIIAKLANELGDYRHHEAVIVSGDKDLYQLLREGKVVVYHPREQVTVTEAGFRKRYGVPPRAWAIIKAISGCPSDNVKGVLGIGEKTAIKHVRGELKPGSNAARNVLTGTKIIRRNMGLVKLPHAATGDFDLRDDEPSPKAWRDLMGRLGIRTLRSV